MKKSNVFIIVSFILCFFSAPKFVGADVTDALDQISKEIESSNTESKKDPISSAAPTKQGSSASSDALAHLGKPIATQTDAQGKATSTYKNPDGTYEVVETDNEGNILSQKKFGAASKNTNALVDISADGKVTVQPLADATVTDAATGGTLTVEEDTDGARTLIKKDAKGNLISEEIESDEVPETSSTDSKSGLTTTVQQDSAGEKLVTERDADGNIISEELESAEEPMSALPANLTSSKAMDIPEEPAPSESEDQALAQNVPNSPLSAPTASAPAAVAQKPGVTTTTQVLPDGTKAVTTTLHNKTVLGQKSYASSMGFDKKMGATPAAADPSQTTSIMTKKDKDGNVIGQETQVSPGSSYDSQTGITTTSQALPDGSQLVIKIDRQGNVLSQEIQPSGAPVEIRTRTHRKTRRGTRTIPQVQMMSASSSSSQKPAASATSVAS